MAKSDTTIEAIDPRGIATNMNRSQRDALRWITDEDAPASVSPSAVFWCVEQKLAKRNGRDHVTPTDLGREVRRLIG